jgi:chemotaxis protein MotB
MADEKSIIVIKKKKGGHGGAHGGAWKIAYADFVTAMMAFFMVMWLLNSAESKTRAAIASYFRKPSLFTETSDKSVLTGSQGILPEGVTPEQHKGETEYDGKVQAPPKSIVESEQIKLAETISGKLKELKALLKKMTDDKLMTSPRDAALATLEHIEALQNERKEISELKEQIKHEIMLSPELKELLGELEVKVDADGLTIEIMDTKNNSMFESGHSIIMPQAVKAFEKIALILKPMSNTIDIIGHTDAKPFGTSKKGYSNWELSADRANSARRLLEDYGLNPIRFKSVVGRSDQDLKIKENPLDPSNRRITLKMRFNLAHSKKVATEESLVNSLSNHEKLLNEKQPKNNPVHSLTAIEVIRPKTNAQTEQESRTSVSENSPEFEENEATILENPLTQPLDVFDY